ncbi:MAG: hypothetical protein FWC64_09370 [Treponema sp.]|nr:hypothetical protein [Treponema sp.]
MKIGVYGKLSILIALMLLVTLSGCYRRISPVVRNIHSSVENGDTIFLGDFTRFEWDNVIIANPGTSNRDILLFLGDRGRANMDFDIQVVVIFRKGDRVVHFYRYIWRSDRRHPVEFSIGTNTYQVFSIENAFFHVRIGEGRRGRRHVTLTPVDLGIMEMVEAGDFPERPSVP